MSAEPFAQPGHASRHLERGEGPGEWLECVAAASLVELPCGHADVHYGCGFVDLEHDRVVCDGKPSEGEQR